MVSARGEVKLLDFGVVKAAEGRVARTEMGVVKGNVTYMAPEQARGLDVDARADLYSLALVMYMLRDGRAALQPRTPPTRLLMKAGAGPGVEDRSAIRDLPASARGRHRARHRRRSIEDRYPNARAMAADAGSRRAQRRRRDRGAGGRAVRRGAERRVAPDGDVHRRSDSTRSAHAARRRG